MFDTLLNFIFKDILVDAIMHNFTGMFDDINTGVGNIADQVGQTPQGWNV